jgi:hypothetical protein
MISRASDYAGMLGAENRKDNQYNTYITTSEAAMFSGAVKSTLGLIAAHR